MDTQTVQQTVGWIQQNVGDSISKQDLVQKVQSSPLPQDAKSAVQQMPDGQLSKQDIVQNLQSKITAGVGGGGQLGGQSGMPGI